jgi:hypothetical protein
MTGRHVNHPLNSKGVLANVNHFLIDEGNVETGIYINMFWLLRPA